MSSSCQRLVFPFPWLAAVLASLAFIGASAAQPPKPPKPPKPAPPPKGAPKPPGKPATPPPAAPQPSDEQKQAVQLRNMTESELLKEAYILVVSANGDYGNHRGKAVRLIEQASNILDARVLKQGTVAQQVQTLQDGLAAKTAKIEAQQTATVHEVQFLSDLQLSSASGFLQQAAFMMAVNQQNNVIKPVQAAINEINAALQISIKGHEVEVLKEAYVYLCAANNDYGTHRPRAVSEIEKAINILDNAILKQGTFEQRIKALQDDRAAAEARKEANASTAVHEYQASSDYQMYIAGVLIRQVGATVAGNKQQAVLGHVRAALKEIDAALKPN